MNHDTPRLGKPFKTVKSISFVTYDSNGDFHHAKAHLYLDSRGDAGFAIGIPQAVYDAIGEYASENDYTHRTVRIHVNKTGGEPYVKAATASDVAEDAKFVFNLYKKMVDEMNRQEVIRVYFHALVPEYDDTGTFTGAHLVNPSRMRFGGSAGTSIELNFSFQRGFRVGDKFVVKRDDGSLHRDQRGHGNVEIPFTQQAWDQLTSIRETITTAIQALAGVFGSASENIPALLAAGFAGSKLLAPPTSQPEQVLEVRAGGTLIRRTRK
jgi:hypothetical protein